jgi:uncharacterized membrane protein YfcA
MSEFWTFAAIGFMAQLIDGSLGMGYGMISSASLLVAGVPPAYASAATHAAKLFTSTTSAISHSAMGNVDRRIFIRLSTLGSIGGIIGAYAITQFSGASIKPYIMMYLAFIGLLIIYRSFKQNDDVAKKPSHPELPSAIGLVGGFVDGVGGGGWGPVTTTSLIGTHHNPRKTVGSVNAAEAVITLAIISAFFITHLAGAWRDAESISSLFTPVLGLIVGGVPSAVVAGYLPKLVNPKKLSAAVGVLILCIAGQQLYVAFT